MCLGVPGQIVGFDGEHDDLAVVDVGGVTRTVSIRLLEPHEAALGNWVLIHVGFALAPIDEAEARATMATLAELGEPERGPRT